MNLYATRECDCRASIPRGAKRPERCVEHGNPYLTQKALEASRKPRPRINPISEKRQREIDEGERPRTGSTLKRTEPKRDWIDARAKVDHEGCCRICKRTDLPLEAAHVLGREHDEPKTRIDAKSGELIATKILYVDPLRIFPACGPFPSGCHGAQHRHEVDLLRHLTLDEQVQAVKDAGSIEAAHIRLTKVS